MSRIHRLASFVAVLVVVAAATPARAQYSQISTPLHQANDSFFERMNVGFGFNIPGAGFIRQGDRGPSGTIGLGPTGAPTPGRRLGYSGGGGGLPPFGGHNAAGDANFGFGMVGGGVNAFGNLGMSQGSSRSFVSETPTVVIPNGGQGTIIDATQRPFVTGVIPVVGGVGVPMILGGYGPGPGFGAPMTGQVSPLFERIQRLNAGAAARGQSQRPRAAAAAGDNNRVALGGGVEDAPSTAEHGDLSVAEIRRRQEAQGAVADEELATWIERARGAEAEGKQNVARIYYRMAAQRATGEVRQQLVEKYREMGGSQP